VNARSLILLLVVMAAVYVCLDVDLAPSRMWWTLGLCGVALAWLTLAGGMIGGALWSLDRAFTKSRRRRPGPRELWLYTAIGAATVFALLLFRVYAYAHLR
jgi:uncharacterized membrane protein